MRKLFLKNIGSGFLIIFLASCGSGINSDEIVTPRASSRDGGSAQERQMAALTLIWDARLSKVARARAQDMAKRGYFSHVDPDGRGPNWHVTQAGYRLPIKWTAFDKANQIESILGGYASAEAAFKYWLDSPKHATHLLARSAFYQEQTRYGIGYANVPNSEFKHYWVFLSAPPES